MIYRNDIIRWIDAVDADDFEAARRVLLDKPELLSDPENVAYMMYYAASHFKPRALAALVELGVDINLPLSESRPDRALWHAAILGGREPGPAIETIRWLVEHGARVNFGFRDDPPYPYPLMQAIKNNNLEMVRLMVSTGEDLNLLGGKINQTPLSWAIENGRTKIADFLRSKGALESHQVPGYVPPPAPDPIPDFVAAHIGPPEPPEWVPVVPDGDDMVTVRAVVRDDDVWFFTQGMSARPMAVPPGGEPYQYAELVTGLYNWPSDHDVWLEPEYVWPITWLRRLARYPFEHATWLGGPTAVIANGDPPAPLGSGTETTCWLMLADHEPLTRVTMPDGRSVVFYTMIPIHTAERDYEALHGTAALLKLFDEHDITHYLDPMRPSVV